MICQGQDVKFTSASSHASLSRWVGPGYPAPVSGLGVLLLQSDMSMVGLESRYYVVCGLWVDELIHLIFKSVVVAELLSLA